MSHLVRVIESDQNPPIMREIVLGSFTEVCRHVDCPIYILLKTNFVDFIRRGVHSAVLDVTPTKSVQFTAFCYVLCT